MEKNKKSYKVNEVATLLGTNEETVRRWIRIDKLHASQQSKKTGNIISDDDLRTFLQDYPKYFKRFMASTASVAEQTTANFIAGLGLSILGAAGVTAVKILRTNRTKDDISQEDIIRFAKQQIDKLEARIKQKRSAIAELEEEIGEYQAEIENYQMILEKRGDELERIINKVKNADK